MVVDQTDIIDENVRISNVRIMCYWEMAVFSTVWVACKSVVQSDVWIPMCAVSLITPHYAHVTQLNLNAS